MIDKKISDAIEGADTSMAINGSSYELPMATISFISPVDKGLASGLSVVFRLPALATIELESADFEVYSKDHLDPMRRPPTRFFANGQLVESGLERLVSERIISGSSLQPVRIELRLFEEEQLPNVFALKIPRLLTAMEVFTVPLQCYKFLPDRGGYALCASH